MRFASMPCHHFRYDVLANVWLMHLESRDTLLYWLGVCEKDNPLANWYFIAYDTAKHVVQSFVVLPVIGKLAPQQSRQTLIFSDRLEYSA